MNWNLPIFLFWEFLYFMVLIIFRLRIVMSCLLWKVLNSWVYFLDHWIKFIKTMSPTILWEQIVLSKYQLSSFIHLNSARLTDSFNLLKIQLVCWICSDNFLFSFKKIESNQSSLILLLLSTQHMMVYPSECQGLYIFWYLNFINQYLLFYWNVNTTHLNKN